MTRNMYVHILLSISMVAVLSTSAWADDHDHEHHDIVIGHDGAGNLKLEFGHDNEGFAETHTLEPASGPFSGWEGEMPGFASLDADEPDESFYALPGTVDVQLEIVALDADFAVWTPGLESLGVGESYALGAPDIHAHVHWNILPTGDPLHDTYEATFRLVDDSGQFNTTGDYTLTFVPEPASITLIGLAALLRRRR